MGSVLVERTLAEHKRTRLIFNLIKQTIVGLFDQCMELDRKYATFTFKLKKSDFKSHWAKVAKLLQPFYKFSIELSMCESVSLQTIFLTDFHYSMFYGLTISSCHGFLKTQLCSFLKLLFKREYIERSHLNMKLCHFHALKRYSKKQKQNKNKQTNN